MFASEVKADVLHLSPNVADAPLADMLRVDVGIDSAEPIGSPSMSRTPHIT